MRLPEGFIRPEYVMSVEDIERHLQYIDEIMTTKLDDKNMDDISERMSSVMECISVSNDLVSSSGYYLNEMRRIRYEEAVKTFPIESPSVLNGYVNSKCADFKFLYDKCERTNKGMTHYLDALRSLMSKEKELNRQLT